MKQDGNFFLNKWEIDCQQTYFPLRTRDRDNNYSSRFMSYGFRLEQFDERLKAGQIDSAALWSKATTAIKFHPDVKYGLFPEDGKF